MRISILLVSLWLLGIGTASAKSSCWILSELQGIAYFQDNGYQPQVDGLSDPMTLILDGENTSVSGSGVPLRQIAEFMAAGHSSGDAFTTIETYQVDPALGVAIYTKALDARSVYSKMSGARAFVGKAKRC